MKKYMHTIGGAAVATKIKPDRDRQPQPVPAPIDPNQLRRGQ